MLKCSMIVMILTGTITAAEPATSLNGWPLLVKDDFAAADFSRWEFSDPNAWRLGKDGDNPVIEQYKHIVTQTPVRSPFNRGLLKDVVVGNCVLDVRLQSTTRDYDHRSLVLFFGYQDPAHMYYVHFGKKTDDHANQIFIVNDEPRKKISTKTTTGTPWNDAWHHARVVRNVDSGQIDIFFDNMETPAMTAVDKTFTWGQVGLGSFDDTGRFDDLRVYGLKKDNRN